ncbi:MAG: hypothetical protein IJC00_06365 [Clostridia bacterium]|nr:hypothetical protein [Clostridia bacterium]
MSKKLLALVLSAAMLLGLVGCLEEKPAAEANKADAQPAATQSAATDTAAADELPAFTLGDFTVTVGEVRSSYNTVIEYMGYYGVSAPTTAEEIGQYRNMVIEDLLSAKVLPWKAKEELGEDADPVALAEKAREFLKKDVEEYFGYSFDRWLGEVTTSYEESALTELLQDEFNKGVSITEADAKAWFETEAASQKESFEEDYAAYKEQDQSYRLGDSGIPALYTPEGFGRMQVLTFDVDPDDSAAYSANELEMTNLESEYGKLVLRDLDEDRQAQIVARYQELQAANAGLLQKSGDKAQLARADALKGTDFVTLFNTYSNEEGTMGFYGYAEGEPRRDGTVIFYTKAQDEEWPQQVWEAAVALQEGEISELIQVGDSFYLIQRLADLPAGASSFDDDPETFTAAALSARQTEEWNAVQEDWLNEARNAATFYEDNYAGVGVQ